MIIRGRETGRQRINEGMEEERVSTLLIVHALRLEERGVRSSFLQEMEF